MGNEDRAAIALLASALRPDARASAWTLGWLVLAGLLDALAPLLGKVLIDSLLVAKAFAPRAAMLLVGGMLVAGWSASGLRYVALVRLARVAMRSVERLRRQVFAHVLALPIAYFDRAITGQLVSRITNDTEQIRQLYVQVLFEVLQGLTMMLGAIVAMAWLDWRLMLIVLTLAPVMVVIVRTYRRLSAPAVAATRALRSDINAQVAEGIAGMAVLQASGAAPRAAQHFASTNEQHYASRQREVRANAWLLRPAIDFVKLLLIIAALVAFGLLNEGSAASQVVEVGLLYAFITYIGRVVDPLIQITQQFSMLQHALVCAARLDSLLAQPTDPPQVAPATAPATAPASGAARVRFDRLGFGYDPLHPVLQAIDLDIAPGEFIGIVGHTGAGKSTLLSLLLRFYQPTAGTIRLDDAPLAVIDDMRFRAEVGLVPQEPFLLAASTFENVDVGRGLDPATIRQALTDAGADRLVAGLPDGHDTPLGEGGARLSAGEKQLVAIARALAGRPRLLLLDEATSRIDSQTEQQVSRAVAALRGKVTVIAIAHRLSTVRAADRIVVLDRGRLVELGTHEHLVAIEGGVYQRLWRMQDPDAAAAGRSAAWPGDATATAGRSAAGDPEP